MFSVKLICFYFAIYAILFFSGIGLSSLICRRKNERYRYWLAPIIGILVLSILPIYFSLLGINTSTAGWVIFILSGCYSIYSLIRVPPAKGTIKADSLVLPAAVLLALIPSLTVVLKAGYLTSTMESYSAFITIPADFLLNNTFNQTVVLDYSRPITNLLAEVVGNQEYFGPFFLVAALSAILGVPAYKLYLVSSGIIASFIPLSSYIAAREGFGLQRKWALLLSILVSLNYSFFVWPMVGQMPMTGGMVYLILAIGFIPSFFESETRSDYALLSVLIAGVLSMYWILIPYLVGVYLLYGFLRFRSSSVKSAPLRAGIKLTIGTLIINPFTLIFLSLHGVEMVTTTSQFTKNIPRYPYIEEILGFGQHFSMAHDGKILSLLILGIAFASVLLISIGCYVRFKDKDFFFVSVLSVFLLLGCYFYLIDFTYHFYKNAVLGVFALLVAFVIGVSWAAARSKFILTKCALILLVCLFVGLNMNTMVTYSLTNRRVIDQSLITLPKLMETARSDNLTLVNSFDPTEEAWICYFLRDRKLKIRGSIETWGFWILAPFSGEPNSAFFFDPKSDSIDYTLFYRPQNRADIIHPRDQELVAANDDYILVKGLTEPCLFEGWYPAEKSDRGVYRWTEKESELLIGESDKDLLLQITGEIPDFYDGPLGIQFLLNGEVVERVESGPAHFTQKCLLRKNSLRNRYNIFSISLDRTFCPGLIRNTGDMRSLGLAVSSIELMPEELFGFSELIDIGNSDFDKYLLKGWSFNEGLKDKTTFRWVQGKDASLTIFLQSVKNMKLEFRALPFRYPKCPPQEATIYVNGNVVGRVVLTNVDWDVYSVDIPAELLEKGLNAIRFVFRSSASPANVLAESDDLRSLSVAFDCIRIYQPS